MEEYTPRIVQGEAVLLPRRDVHDFLAVELLDVHFQSKRCQGMR